MNKFTIITPVYNAEKYIDDCIQSVINQTYQNYQFIIINDTSTDQTKNIIDKYSDNDKVIIQHNETRRGSALHNMIEAMKLTDDNDIIVTVDGDDKLYNNEVLAYLNDVYSEETWMTYGQFIPMSGSYGKYCKKIHDVKTYRKSDLWYASHLRTFRKKLWMHIDDKDLRDTNGEYYKIAHDCAFIFPMLEMCGNTHYKFIDEILYFYNDLNELNDMKVNAKLQVHTAGMIRNKLQYKELTQL